MFLDQYAACRASPQHVRWASLCRVISNQPSSPVHIAAFGLNTLTCGVYGWCFDERGWEEGQCHKKKMMLRGDLPGEQSICACRDYSTSQETEEHSWCCMYSQQRIYSSATSL